MLTNCPKETGTITSHGDNFPALFVLQSAGKLNVILNSHGKKESIVRAIRRRGYPKVECRRRLRTALQGCKLAHTKTARVCNDWHNERTL